MSKKVFPSVLLVAILVMLFSQLPLYANRDYCGDDGSLKVDPAISGTYSEGDFEVEVEVYDTSQGQKFNFRANRDVLLVAVKGGPNYNLYDFGDGDPSENGLHALKNDNSGKYYDLSHIVFCYKEEGDCRSGGGDCDCEGRHGGGDGCDPTQTPQPTATATDVPTEEPTSSPTPIVIIITATPTAMPSSMPTSTPEPTLPPIITNTPTPFPTIVITPLPPTATPEPGGNNYYYLPIIRCEGNGDPFKFCTDAPYS